MSKAVTRLYTQFQPESYQLDYVIDKKALKFHGTVTITGRKTGRPSQRLTFHQKDLKIDSAKVTVTDKKGSRELPIERINQHEHFNEVRLHCTDMLYPGQYRIELNFHAAINRGMTGIYPCFFMQDGQEHSLIMTQFESHHAREAFPCIDEPEAKATFDLTLTHKTGLQALANTPIANAKDNGDGTTTTSFATSPKMSSYLLAFVIGELIHKDTKTKNGTDVSVWATTAQPAESLDFALEVAKGSIEFFEDYFKVPYPLPKSDHVAVPDFSAGAMENWGLITYRERVLLAYPGETSQSIKETIALVVAHETSHQWFGNLVTMRWWDDLWLNESFANMMEYQAVDALYPEWHVWDAFVASEGLSALRRDATPGVQAVRIDVHHPDEISTLFDPSIVYAKGGRLLYMLKSYIGETAFQHGLSAYFTKHAYGNTQRDDLWAALSEASGIDVGAFMNPWLERSGFPVISVEQLGGDVSLTQHHFLDNPKKTDTDRIWPVPLFSSSKDVPKLFENRSIKRTVTHPQSVFINDGARGHYIVNYKTPEQQTALVAKLTSGVMSNAERLIVLNDASMLARAGYQPYGAVLELLQAYKNEASEPVWDIMALVIAEARRFAELDETLEDKIKAYVRSLIATQYTRLGWDEQPGESSADQKLRATIIGLGSYAEEPAIVARARQLFADFKAGTIVLPAELRSIIFGVPIKQGDQVAFDYLLQLHDTTTNSDLQADISGALTTTRSPELAQKLLDRLKQPELVKPQDADRWLVYVMRNRYVRSIGWDWMVNEWPWIEKTYSHDKSYDYMPRYAASACATRSYANAYKAFFEPKLDQIVLKRNILVGIEEIDNRVNWLERDLASVQAFFTAQS